MAGTQALSAARAPAFSFDPRDLVLATDPRDPLFDKSVHKPVYRVDVIDVAIRGIHTPPSVRRRGADSVVVIGRQRTKRAIVANALGAGQLYKGPVKAVQDAIREMGADADFVARVSLLMRGKPLKVKVVACNSGSESETRMLMRSENSRRQVVTKEERIAAAREDSEKYGATAGEIAEAEGVSVATVKRWLASDPSEPVVDKKARGKSKRPSGKTIDRVFGSDGWTHLTHREQQLLRWFAGTCADGAFEAVFPELARAVAS